MWCNSPLYPAKLYFFTFLPACSHLPCMTMPKAIDAISECMSLASCREGTITLLLHDVLLYMQPGIDASPAGSHFRCMAITLLHGSLATDLNRSRFTSHLQLAESVSP